jgi:hypothetical protein
MNTRQSNYTTVQVELTQKCSKSRSTEEKLHGLTNERKNEGGNERTIE